MQVTRPNTRRHHGRDRRRGNRAARHGRSRLVSPARRRLQSERQAEGVRHRTLFEYAPDGIVIADSQSYYLDANPAICQMLGYSRDELIGMHASDIVAPAEIAHIAPALDTLTRGIDYGRRWTFRRKNGTTFPAEVIATQMPDGHLLAMIRDVSDRLEAESTKEQLRQAQKMEAVGQLAGGIAHDFNNLLSVILSYSDMVQQQLPAELSVRADVGEIRRAAERATELTRQLLAFSRRQILQPTVIDVGQVLIDMQSMLRRLLGEDVELSVSRSAMLGHVLADPTQIEQIVMNLAVNARDAMPRGGKLHMEVANAELDATYAASHHNVQPGDYVMLAISDTGTGMDAATRERIFEPFFTTKEHGKGTGLGLSTVFGIVAQSRGHIGVYSEVNRGTTFKVYLPRTDLSPSSTAVVPVSPVTLHGSETVLLCEDDDQVRAVVAQLLSRSGYSVLVASDGDHAIELSTQHTHPIALLITDVVMPGLSGRDLATQLTQHRGGLKVLYVSGYTEGAIVQHGVLEAGITFLQKPITPDALLRKVRQVLDGP